GRLCELGDQCGQGGGGTCDCLGSLIRRGERRVEVFHGGALTQLGEAQAQLGERAGELRRHVRHALAAEQLSRGVGRLPAGGNEFRERQLLHVLRQGGQIIDEFGQADSRRIDRGGGTLGGGKCVAQTFGQLGCGQLIGQR